MPKLLFLVTEDWYFASHRLHLALAAQAAGYEVAVATRLGLKQAILEGYGLRVIDIAMTRHGLNPWAELHTISCLVRVLRLEQPDILHAVAMKPVLLGGIAARLAGIRHIVAAITGLGFLFTDNGRAPLIASLIRRLLPWLVHRGRVIVQNTEDRTFVLECGIPQHQVQMIRGAGVDIQAFHAQPEPMGIPVAMLAARLLRDKGVVEFVAAARQLQAEGVVARFVLVGAPDPGNPTSIPEAELQSWVDQGLVEWWGIRDDMPAVLAQAHLVCLPTFYREGLPKVILEAMACGRAVIATDVPGCRDAVTDGETGLLVPAKDAHALARAIRRLLDFPDLRRRMGEHGRKRVVGEFSQTEVASQTLAIYREFLA